MLCMHASQRTDKLIRTFSTVHWSWTMVCFISKVQDWTNLEWKILAITWYTWRNERQKALINEWVWCWTPCGLHFSQVGSLTRGVPWKWRNPPTGYKSTPSSQACKTGYRARGIVESRCLRWTQLAATLLQSRVLRLLGSTNEEHTHRGTSWVKTALIIHSPHYTDNTTMSHL